jgi:glucose-6-phosphate dehydrogenase assembly protein OpcA
MIADDVHVDYSAIEKSLAELWRGEKQDGEKAVTRAALWNVIAHTWDSHEHSNASETLAKASAAVPQRTIVIRSAPAGEAEMSSWISANCHLIGGNKQVCSEEISIVAGGHRVHDVAPLVNALLIPDMPVAVWWLGDLPHEQGKYVETLLDPADRLIVDSRSFDDPRDLALLQRIASSTTTAPADLSWVRLEEWRAATAGLFDAPEARARLQRVRSVRVVHGGDGRFGWTAEAWLYVAWLMVQSGNYEIDFDIAHDSDAKGIASTQLTFDDLSTADISRDRERGVVVAQAGEVTPFECVTRVQGRGQEDLIVRQLKRPEADRVYMKALPVATELSNGTG